MSWVKVTDLFNGAKEFAKAHELAAERGDDRLVLELKGATIALFTHSAGQWSDYVISFGDAVAQLGLTRANEVLRDLMIIGIVEDVSNDSERKYKLVERENFVHNIKTTDKAMKQKRTRDRNKGSLVVPVLLRDGDNCRYCGIEVNWDNHVNDEGGTFDHREPDKETTPENYVVCCRGCNNLRFEFGSEADFELPLLEVPEEPLYGEWIRNKLSKWSRITERTAAAMGIVNPLKRGNRRFSSESTSVPLGSQSEGERQSFPSAPGELLSEGRVAYETQKATTKNLPVHPIGSQPDREKQYTEETDETVSSTAIQEKKSRKRRRRRK